MNPEFEKISIFTFYKFVTLDNYYDMKDPIMESCVENNIKGTILLADEGINATISGLQNDIEKLMKFLKSDERFSDLSGKFSFASFIPFEKMKVRLKREIVSLDIPNIDAKNNAGTYLDPQEWDEALENEDSIVIDTRNDYEVKMGCFKNSINPNTENFRNLPDWVDAINTSEHDKKNKKILMYCTGGIRCEKSTAYMKQCGFQNVYHLKGGILDYLEKTENKKNNWIGDCFVFDDRIAVDDKLSPLPYAMCTGCNIPMEINNIQNSSKGKVFCQNCNNE